MADILSTGAPLIFMKVGVHAHEKLEDILKRKSSEFDQAGMIFWGYGGNTCHPTQLVQPFVREHSNPGRPVHLMMNKIDSHHFAEPKLAKEYSDDGIRWKPIPAGIHVLGSRYAMVIGQLLDVEIDLDLRNTVVGVGPSRGANGGAYVQGRVDKGCLVMAPPDLDLPECTKHIEIAAPLIPPYAVFVR
jgi:hypothetical protein